MRNKKAKALRRAAKMMAPDAPAVKYMNTYPTTILDSCTRKRYQFLKGKSA